MPTTKKSEQPTIEEAPGEYPVLGYEPLYVPKGFSLEALIKRVEDLEAQTGSKSSASTKK